MRFRHPRESARWQGVASGEIGPDLRPAVMVGDDLLRVFQEGKDAAEQADPPDISLGPAFDPQPDYR